MVKLKLALPVLALLQIFQFLSLPQSAKCFSSKVTDKLPLIIEEIQPDNIPVNDYRSNTGDKTDGFEIVEIEIPNIESEYVIPINVFGIESDFNDTRVVKEIERSDFLENSGTKDLNLSDPDVEIIGIIENRIASQAHTRRESNISKKYDDIEIFEVASPEMVSVQSYPSEFSELDNDDQKSIFEIPYLTFLDFLTGKEKRNNSETDEEEIIRLIENGIISESQSKNVNRYRNNEETISPKTKLVRELRNGTEELRPSEIFQQPFKRSAPNMISVTVTAPKSNPIYEEYIREHKTYEPQYSDYEPQYSDYEPSTCLSSTEGYSIEPAEIFSYAKAAPLYTSEPMYLNQPLTVTIDQSTHASSYLNSIFKRDTHDFERAFTHKRSAHNPDMNNYVEYLNIHDVYQPFSMNNHNHDDHQYSFNKRSPSNDFQGEYCDKTKHITKRSATCGCSNCSKTTDSSCSPEIIVKPTFIVDEVIEKVQKPAFKVTETPETIIKPEFVVKEIMETIPKPKFSVQEKVETVVKPNYVIEESNEKVNKPAFKIVEQPENIVKPDYIIDEVPEYVEKLEFIIEDNVETVVKPKYKVETQTETLDKPNFVIQDQVLQVHKPEFVVTEKTEKVIKPEFKVDEKVETVTKPKYQIKDEIVRITKPNYIVEPTEVVVERPEFIVTEEILKVQKPLFLIKDIQEIVEKPEFYITDIVENVDKPKYLVEETQETVIKPSYNVKDEHQTVVKPQFVVKEETEYLVKPEFVVEDITIPVDKPEYVVEEIVENVQKPCFLVKPVPYFVEKPEFVVNDVVEKVNKPSFNVVEKKETIIKPSFSVEEDVQTIVKPCFNVVTCSGPPRRIPPKFVKSSRGRQHYSRRPSYHKRRSHSQTQQRHRQRQSPLSTHSID